MAEDWLNEEAFDFDLNMSGSSTEEGVLNRTDDDEVFIGPMTHKEKCMAFIVQEREAMRSVERLNPDQQAMLLQESALINLRIKSRGTPGRRNMSPVAVVRPMQTEIKESETVLPAIISEENKENIPGDKVNSAVPSVLSDNSPKSTKKLSSQPSLTDNSPKSTKKFSSQPSLKKPSRLSMSVKPTLQKSGAKFAEPLPLGTPSTSSSKSTVTSTKVEQPQKLKRQSSIPKQGITKSKSDASIPSTSGLPTLRGVKPVIAKPGIKNRKGAKSLSQSAISQSQAVLPTRPGPGVAQPQLKLASRKGASTSNDTPASRKISQLRLSQKRTSLGVERQSIGSPTPAKSKTSEKPAAKLGDHVTPVMKSARKSIVGRQLNPNMVAISKSPSPIDEVGSIRCASPTDQVESITCTSPNSKVESVSSNSNIQDPNSVEIEENILKDSNKTVIVEDTPLQSGKSEECHSCSIKSEERKIENDSCTESKSEVAVQENNIDNTCIPQESLLIDIFDCLDSNGDALTKDSPPKINKTDPFETGNTPPPLIELGEILEPVREEVNLIEF